MTRPPYTIILAPNSSMMTGPGTNTIVLGGGIEGATVIDPADDNREHLEAIIQEGAERGGIRRILITHGHPDHIGAAAILRKQIRNSIYAFNREGVPEADEEVPDSMTFPAGDDTLRAIHTPGHRFDHLSYYLEGQRTLFAGDLVAGTGTVVIAPPEGDLLDYLASLKHLQRMDISEIVPSHGPIITNPKAKLNEYVMHRMLREQQLVDTMQQFPTGATIPQLVEIIYADVDPKLHALAGMSVEAHLLKLERENRAQHVEDKWLLKDE